MNLFDIMGPIMVGPSSSHTAGAVRIGQIARRLLGGRPDRAELLLTGSFAATGKGHGTDRALIAGLLDMAPDDARIPRSPAVAEACGMVVTVSRTELRGVHPNTVLLRLTHGDKRMSVQASSLGGGRVRINAIDGMEAAFDGEAPTLIIRNEDRPGVLGAVTALLGRSGMNIATMQLYRDRRGGLAVMVLEFDQPVPEQLLAQLRAQEDVRSVTYLEMDGP